MRVNSKVVIDIESGAVLWREASDYGGPVAEAISFGGNKSQQKQKSNASQESGVNYNEDFLRPAQEFARGGGTSFNALKYLKEHPDVAADPYYGQNPEEHYKYAQQIGDKSFEGDYYTPTQPEYNPQYVRGTYTPFAKEGFDKLESDIYGTQASKLTKAYNDAIARQREELAQTGALNSPAQYLEGSARSSMDKGYLESTQQAARDANQARLAAEQVEAARRTAFDTGEAARETGFSQQTQQQLVEDFMKKLALAIQASQFSKGESASSGKGSGMGGNFGFLSNSSSPSSDTSSWFS